MDSEVSSCIILLSDSPNGSLATAFEALLQQTATLCQSIDRFRKTQCDIESFLTL